MAKSSDIIREKRISVVGMRCVGRPQTNGTLASLYNCMDLWDTLIILGKLDESSTLIVGELQREKKVIWDTRLGLSGEQAQRLIYHVMNLALDDDELVLFMDDDQVFNRVHLETLIAAVKDKWVAVLAQNVLENTQADIDQMVRTPSFDFFSVARAELFNKCPGEELWLLSELNEGGEFFYINWMFKRIAESSKNRKDRGIVKSIEVVDMQKLSPLGRRPLHLWIRDRYKNPWLDKIPSWWENLFAAMSKAKNAQDMKKLLVEGGIISKDKKFLEKDVFGEIK